MEPSIKSDQTTTHIDVAASTHDRLVGVVGSGTMRPLRLQVLSGLHLDERPEFPIRLVDGVDAVVVAGDTSRSVERTFTYLRKVFPHPTPVLTILGSGSSGEYVTGDELRRARAASNRHRIALLEDRTYFFKGVRFVGASSPPALASDGPGARRLSAFVTGGDNDYPRSDGYGVSRTAATTRARHTASREPAITYLGKALAQGWYGPTVVITHRMPSTRRAAPSPSRDGERAEIADGSDTLVGGSGVVLWIYGHGQGLQDRRLGHTRVIRNARGRDPVAPSFVPDLVVQVPRWAPRSGSTEIRRLGPSDT